MTLATFVLATIHLSLTNVLLWLLVGLVAGFLASRVMRGGGYGLIGDIVVGLIGAFIGGWLAGFLGLGGSSSLIMSIVIAFIGACILLAILHAVSGGGGSRSRGWGRR
ncbi:MAG: GlsB/YeaQ/YmgE family stress response membrane protein [Ktedonobacteraceae bacterium]